MEQVQLVDLADVISVFEHVRFRFDSPLLQKKEDQPAIGIRETIEDPIDLGSEEDLVEFGSPGRFRAVIPIGSTSFHLVTYCVKIYK